MEVGTCPGRAGGVCLGRAERSAEFPLIGAWLLPRRPGRYAGARVGGPGPLGDVTVTGGRVDGNDVKFQFDVTSFGPRLTFLLTGELDAAGTTIEGMLNMAGMDSPFTAVK